MPATTTAAEPLRDDLNTHHERFSPVYGGYLSDHGPMAALALSGLGADTIRIRDWLHRYRRRLDPIEAAPAAYLEHLGSVRADVSRRGAEAVLAESLPRLVSGWARHAYHPLIRTAYGYAFDLPGEVAAGIACLAWSGPDPVLESLARDQREARDADSPFAAMRACATRPGPGRRFDDCLDRVTRRTPFSEVATALDDPLAAYGSRTLAIFDSTHDFFALHLVTAAHAFRVLYRFAGPRRDAIYALGLLAGYASVGAPEYTRTRAGSDEPPDWLALVKDDEHDIKVAYSADSQTAYFGDPAYIQVAARYLAR